MNKVTIKNLISCLFLSAFLSGSLYLIIKNGKKLPALPYPAEKSINLNKVVIGTVSCTKANDSTSNNETVVFIKSVLISAKLYNVKHVEFHIFLEFLEDKKYFLETLKQFGYPNEQVKVTIYFHSALDAVPKKFHSQMTYREKFRCEFTRLYLAETLDHVDAIMFMENNFIVTGNILELWKHYGKLNDQQLIGVVANIVAEKYPVTYKTVDCFRNVPYVYPKGINSGLILMNLTRMRQYGWVAKVAQTFKDFNRLAYIEDQILLNIVLYYDPGLLYLLPCQFNIGCGSCDHGFMCKSARENPYGIQCVNGAYKNGRFNYIFDRYKNFDIVNQDVITDLMIPIRLSPEPVTSNGEEKCDTLVNKYLFPNILTGSYEK